MRARIFLKEGRSRDYRLAAELDAQDADDVWRQVEAEPEGFERRLVPGDIVYVGDVYVELNGDGGWLPISPGPLTRRLYGLIGDG
jgi:hypothetical protein